MTFISSFLQLWTTNKRKTWKGKKSHFYCLISTRRAKFRRVAEGQPIFDKGWLSYVCGSTILLHLGCKFFYLLRVKNRDFTLSDEKGIQKWKSHFYCLINIKFWITNEKIYKKKHIF